ncbi:MAG TPA: ACT domain-containing protein [Candidatus Acidoferrales bacterium]|nr:ACT domain-containing protein [Candidatus Acidoferrales bacterium]
MAILKQLRVTLENRAGALAQLCSELAKRAVNINAIDASEASAAGSVRLVVSQLDTAKRVCGELGLKYAEERVLAVNIGDRPGSLGRVTRKLAEKGINVEYLYCTVQKGAGRALIVLSVSDIETAARVVR